MSVAIWIFLRCFFIYFYLSYDASFLSLDRGGFIFIVSFLALFLDFLSLWINFVNFFIFLSKGNSMNIA